MTRSCLFFILSVFMYSSILIANALHGISAIGLVAGSMSIFIGCVGAAFAYRPTVPS